MENVKIVAVGDGMVGKTCMLVSYTMGKFPTGYVPTVFENYQAMLMHNAKPMSVSFWDTAGQEDFDRLRPLSYPNTDCFLVCYSITSEVSLANIRHRWIPEIKHYCPTASIILVGMKSDVRMDKRASAKLEARGLKMVEEYDAQTLAKEVGAKGVIECSAKTMYNLDRVVGKAIDCVLEDRKKAQKKAYRSKPVCNIL